MDGCPDRGEVIPIRMYMNGIELSPSYENIHNRLSVKYWINLVLLDEEDRRYFKQTEITIYRKP
jgi:vacuolar protein sorting-associated protein 26